MNKIRIKLNKNWAFYSLFALMMLLVFVRYVFQIDFPPIILLAIAILMSFFGNRDMIIASCLMCIPLTTAFQYTYAMLFSLILFAIKYKNEIKINLSIIPVLLLVLWELSHGFAFDFSPKRLVVMFIPYLFCGILMWQEARKIDYGFAVRSFALCTCVMCVTLLGMLAAQSGFDFAAMFKNMQRLGGQTENSGTVSLTINPNSLGVLCVLAISGLLQLVTTGQKKRGDLLMMILMLVCGTMTMSRTYLALLLIMVLLFWFAQEGSIKKKLRYVLMALGIGAVAIAVLSALFPEVLETFAKRFDVSDITTGRSALLMDYHKFFVSNPKVMFFGIGLTDFSKRIVSEYAVSFNVPHNGIQEALIAWGIPGFVMFLLFMGTMLWRAAESVQRLRLLNCIPLILLLAKIQAGQMITSDYTMLALSYAYLSLSHDFYGSGEM